MNNYSNNTKKVTISVIKIEPEKNDFAPIEVSVKEINQIKFFSSSAKHISNVVNDKLEYSSNIIQFQSANSLHSQNCSDSFEKFFNGQNFKEVTLLLIQESFSVRI